jgi:Spy/CpxP family protein refolding chaperone
MKSLYRLGSAAALLLLLSAWPLMAQVAPRPTSPVPGSTTGTTTQGRRGRREPCWKQAGVSQQVQQQRRQIEESARSQISAICSNSSLSAQQKHQQIQQIHQQTRQQIEGLMTPQQRSAVEACRAQRGEGGHGGGMRGMHRGGGEGPCGELPSANGGKPFQESQESEADDN